MKHSKDRILTTHAGRLTPPSDLAAIIRAVQANPASDHQDLQARSRTAIAEIVRRQAETGIDVVGDGELGRLGGYAHYSERLAGLATRPLAPGEPAAMSQRTAEREEFSEFYNDLAGGQAAGSTPTDRSRVQTQAGATQRMICNGPITYRGQVEIERDIQVFKDALKGVDAEEGFLCVLAPGWIEHSLWNEYYPTDEAFIYALADAMKHEYKAVVDAGFILQIDDPALATKWDMLWPKPSFEDYRRIAEMRVEALNHALAGLPEDRIRYHLCWGSWHGPHVHDIPLPDLVDLILKVRAGAYSLEGANPRHEHDWKVWKNVKLPEGKILIPGVVSHASNVVEHPELVADRIVSYANLVGRENVIAGTDCGMGGRIHPQLAWAKFQVLAEGARMATTELWSH